MNSPLLSILIPTKDRQAIVEECLKNCLKATQNFAVEIVVVNDSKTHELKLSFDSPLIKIYSNPKSGVASARNYAARMATGEILLFLDDDMLVFEDNIKSTLELHAKHSRCFINLNWVYPPEIYTKLQQSNFGRYIVNHGFDSLKGWNKLSYWNDNELFNANGITSQYLSCTKKDFIETGGYNEDFPFAGFEDKAFAEKLRKQNFKIYVYPLSTVFHNELDRNELIPWLERKKRGGITIRTAQELGYDQKLIQYTAAKKIVYWFVTKLKWFWFLCHKLVPNKKSFDVLSFFFIDVLLAVYLYEGYNNYKKYLK